jgi:hypothetical protein
MTNYAEAPDYSPAPTTTAPPQTPREPSSIPRGERGGDSPVPPSAARPKPPTIDERPPPVTSAPDIPSEPDFVRTPMFRRIITTITVSAMIGIANTFARAVLPFSSRFNYQRNSTLVFDGEYITNQKSGVAAEVRMGVAPKPPNDNHCGWIAAYNSFITLGMDVSPAEIVRFIERNNGLIAQGVFGTNPRIFDKLFRANGLTSTTTLFENIFHVFPGGEALAGTLSGFPNAADTDLDELARQGRAIILSYYNAADSIKNGAHYVSVAWCDEEERFTAYNVRSREPTATFDSIHDFLGTRRGLISMTVIC